MLFLDCKLVLVQWQGVAVQHVQGEHHEHRADKHWYWPEDPHEQSRREVECSESHGPEVAASDHRMLHVARWNVGVQRGYQEAGLDIVPEIASATGG
jgi:hypothetical protein